MVAEWLNAAVLKTAERETVPWVRIPPPPLTMKNLQKFIMLAGIAGLLLRAPGAHDRSQAPVLKLVADIPLPGSPSRFDYQSFDPASIPHT